MPINLYLNNGYIDMRSIIETGFPFIFVPGARGIGKTYTALKTVTEDKEEIILLRRTQKECDLQNDRRGTGTSFGKVFDDMGKEYHVTKYGETGYVFNDTDGYTASVNLALSTFATVRGAFDFKHIRKCIYDEFIAEPHVRKIKDEGMAVANFYESVNRNRELQGQYPLQLICLANSVNIANDVFLYFDLVSAFEDMISAQEDIRIIGNKLLILPQHSPISDQKAKTALYQAVNSEFADMAISNKFILNDFTYVHKRSLKEYLCLFRLGDLYMYKHKSRNEFYCTFTRGETKEVYQANYSGMEKLGRKKLRFIAYYFDGLIYFENYNCIALFEKYFKLS